jgi:hypothetical protein
MRKTNKTKQAGDPIPVEHSRAAVGVLARAPAELPAPPAVPHQAEAPATTIADIQLAVLPSPHDTLV